MKRLSCVVNDVYGPSGDCALGMCRTSISGGAGCDITAVVLWSVEGCGMGPSAVFQLSY
jgi:hypothetical protein